MDTDRGEFVGPDRAQQWMKRVEVGQQLKILGEGFEVLEINERTLVVKLLSFEERLGVGGDLESILQNANSNAADELTASLTEQERHRRKMLSGRG